MSQPPRTRSPALPEPPAAQEAIDVWVRRNDASLTACVEAIRALLEAFRADPGFVAHAHVLPGPLPIRDPPALDALSAALGLSPFARAVVALCAAVELDSRVAAACAELQGHPSHIHPTFSLALRVLPGATWADLLPDAPLRRWRVLRLDPNASLTQAELRLDERILHGLRGLDDVPAEVRSITRVVHHKAPLFPSHAATVPSLAEALGAPGATSTVLLHGGTATTRTSVAAAVAEKIGAELRILAARDIPADSGACRAFLDAWSREALLAHRLLCIEVDEYDTRVDPTSALLANAEWPALITAPTPIAIGKAPILVEIPSPKLVEQLDAWRACLGPEANAVEPTLARIADTFGGATHERIQDAATFARARAARDGLPLATALWQVCREQARPDLGELVRRVPPVATWDSLVTSTEQREQLDEIVAHMLHRGQVFGDWGLGRPGARNLGTAALFAGASGTGKTLAAEILAYELGVDLYHLDLSTVVSKYIGETEGNLRRVFAAAEEAGAVLLFDEADALFGRRTEVKDGRDRYANQEVSYLLQRIETYRGLAILTTNIRESLDPAFMRRLRFVVEFPFPEPDIRKRLWQALLPPTLPTHQLDLDKLAQAHVAGGQIRNLVVQAAFRSARLGRPVTMAMLLDLLRIDCAKMKRPLTEREIRGW